MQNILCRMAPEELAKLCDRLLWIEHGKSMLEGSRDEVFAAYHGDLHLAGSQPTGGLMAVDFPADESQRLLTLADQLDVVPMQVVAGIAEVVQTCFGPNGVDADRLAAQVARLRDRTQVASAWRSPGQSPCC